jgi:hypothetical protein
MYGQGVDWRVDYSTEKVARGEVLGKLNIDKAFFQTSMSPFGNSIPSLWSTDIYVAPS